MAETVVFYKDGFRYVADVSAGKKILFQGTEKAQVFVSSLDTPLTIWLDEAQVCYGYDGVEGKLVSGMSLAGGVVYLLPSEQVILDPLDKQELTIGQHAGNSFVLAGSSCHVLLKRSDQSWMLYRLAGSIYINNLLMEKGEMELALGDELAFEDTFFKFYADEVLVAGPVEASDELARKSASRYAFYEDYPDYHRSPRIIYRSSEDRVAINAPSNAPSKPSDSLLKLILPPLMMVGITLVIMIFQPRGLYVLATIAMSIVTLGMSIAGYIKGRKDYQKELRDREGLYHDYLADKAKELAGLTKSQKDGQLYHYPAIETLVDLADSYHHRIYEKTPLHFDFLYYRLGLGEVPVSYDLSYAQTERSGKRDPLELEGFQLYEQNKTISDMPIVANLSHGPVGYIGPRALVIEQLQLMVNQIALFHSYHDVQFITIMPEEEKEQWDWMRFLPHATLQDMNVRGFVYNQRTHDQVLNSLNQILKLRRAQKEDKSNRESTLFSPHYVVLVTDEKLILDHVIMEFFTEDPTELGCSLVFVQDVLSSLSENIKTIINIKDRNTGQLVMEEGQLREIDFALDHFPVGYDKETLVRRLAPLNHLQNLKSSIPETVTFMEMYGAETFEDLGVVSRWEKHAPYKSLAVPLGLRGKEDIVYLNLHEKAHGPHGLVAGTTGSGKSEVIQSYILSLAVNFHPHDVAFLLIDYKGGGMANLFKDLPHLLGTITNLDGAQSMRALVSINAELKRRQRLFATHDVNHINQYQKKYKLGEVSEPMPHLFLISDEFAELKTNQPDFMKELVSTARIGRSLGIHLILATQKPSGVVDDQIWSNSRFKLALKVADRSDSMEMLKTPDAAEITQVGRGYLQVGNNEVYELFQSAWSGADYQPDKDEQGIEDHTIYAINDIGQYEILNEDLSGLDQAESIKEVPSELQAIVSKLKALTERLSIQALPQPWLPPLSKEIFLQDLRPQGFKDLWGQASGLVARLGMVDIPSRQSQEVLEHDFEKDGHIALFSSPSMGKSTFVQTLVMDLARQLTPEELHFYLLDFGTNGLLPLRDLPHTADLLMAEDTEKLTKFMRRIKDELAKRKAAFSRYAVPNLTLYRQASGDELPVIFLVLDNFDGLKEASLGAEMETLLQTLAREGASLGIYLVLTAGRSGALRPGLQASLKTRLALKLTDDVESRTIVGRHQHVMEEVPGRGLVHLDEVEVFQVALPAYAKDSFGLVQAVQDEAKSMAASWTGRRPEGIPVMPESLSFEEFAGLASVREAVAGGELPIGLDFENVESVGLKLDRFKHLVYLSDREEQVQAIGEHLLKTMQELTSYQVMLIDTAGTFAHHQGNCKTYLSGQSLISDMAEQLLYELERRQAEGFTEHFFVVISNYESFLSMTGASQDKMALLLSQGPQVGLHLVVGGLYNFIGVKTDAAVKVLREQAQQFLFGMKLNDQSIVDKVYNSKESHPAMDEVYLHNRSQYDLIKISQWKGEG
ncbi:type VII secretion protein EssC [Streptococcus suis]|uniref:type VII secretion protein EssC n=1 Tax=Streptococcus suis TaxID=1307 RepID=UPI00192E109E|nr:type VII secretion protein EssC [Streptococcus suis]MBL6503079.1 type VII secretion protein EssC [Streptococcus suis]MBM0241706.1 type VII secretion protein EssC [Streptococcus suis]MBO4116553.1 type VII secretion protein EssC [Streptococcus suis]MBO4125009.1 type VII secretion protein EssC [Streptococcus suis]MBO4129377.1 type VII secretion protein EssC [Streptococcus suis]